MSLARAARRLFDGAMMGSVIADRCFRVHEPRWFELRRWWQYWHAKERGRVTIQYHGQHFSLRTVGCPCIKH